MKGYIFVIFFIKYQKYLDLGFMAKLNPLFS